MATHLDMSLDDVIKSSKGGNRERVRERGRTRRGRGRGRGPRGPFRGGIGGGGGGGGASSSGGRLPGSGGRVPGSGRRGPLSVNAQPSPYKIAKPFRRAKAFPWQNDLFEDSIRAAGITGIEIGTKLYVSNLDLAVTNDDIRELFSEIGDLKRYAVHYEKSGRPSGSAEVVYSRRSDAFAALKRYNNVLLDGKPIKIEIVGSNSGIPVSARVSVSGANGKKKRTVVMGSSRPGGSGGPAVANRGPGGAEFLGPRGRGGAREGRANGSGRGRRGGRGGGRMRNGREKKKPVEKSADDLDKDLDKYHAEAMQT